MTETNQVKSTEDKIFDFTAIEISEKNMKLATQKFCNGIDIDTNVLDYKDALGIFTLGAIIGVPESDIRLIPGPDLHHCKNVRDFSDELPYEMEYKGVKFVYKASPEMVTKIHNELLVNDYIEIQRGAAGAAKEMFLSGGYIPTDGVDYMETCALIMLAISLGLPEQWYIKDLSKCANIRDFSDELPCVMEFDDINIKFLLKKVPWIGRDESQVIKT